ncbi:MAG: hypothetical protein R2712_12310 [Vicinamibacterales bacterium]
MNRFPAVLASSALRPRVVCSVGAFVEMSGRSSSSVIPLASMGTSSPARSAPARWTSGGRPTKQNSSGTMPFAG